MTDDTISVSVYADIESVLDGIITRLHGIYDARPAAEDPHEPDPVWDRIDSLYDYLSLVDDDIRRTHFLRTIQELT